MKETRFQIIMKKMQIVVDTVNEVVTRHNEAELDLKNINLRLNSLEEEVKQILKRFEK